MDNFILCPSCRSKNRIPEDKAGKTAKCGKCGEELPQDGGEAGNASPFILRCTSCGGKNRVPREKLKPGVTCGKCHALLQTEDILTPWAIPVSDVNFDSKVLKSPLPVLLEFTSSTCGACNISRPVLDRLAAEWKGKARICRTDVLANPAIANRYQVMSTPISLIFDRGRVVDTIVGAAPREMYLRKMAPYLAQ